MASDAEGLEWLSDYIVSVLKSPAWVAPISQFCDAYCGLFEDCEENKLEYTACHNEFKRLVDDLFLALLLDVSVTPGQFESFCTCGLASNEALHHLLVEQLLSVEDFLSFKAMMVKWNAMLDRTAALECSQPEDPAAAQAVQYALNPGVCAEVPLSLTHNAAQVGYAQWPVTEDVLAWHDRDFTYHGVPDEMLGSMLFAGPHDSVPSGTLTLVSPVAANVYLLYENSGPRRDGGLARRLKSEPAWVKVGGTQMYWGRWKGKYYWVSVWTRKAAAGAPVQIEVVAPWVGGIAVKTDTGEWRLYEEQEQLLRAIDLSKQEAATAEADALVREADRKCEQAELEQAIALSLQAEEERQRQAQQAADAAAAAVAVASSSSAAAAPAVPEQALQQQPPPLAPAEPSFAPEVPVQEMAPDPSLAAGGEVAPAPPLAPAEQPLPVAVEAVAPPAVAEAPPAAAVAAAPVVAAPVPVAAPAVAAAVAAEGAQVVEQPPPEAPKELRPVIPRMVKLQPLTGGPASRPALPVVAGGDLRQRAEVLGATSAAAQPAPDPLVAAAPAPPTEEEKALRAEHLKRQRDLIVQKRAAEREAKLREFQRTQGEGKHSTAAVDRAMGALAQGAPPSTGSEPADPGSADAATLMRQALTRQLRQTLTSSTSAASPTALGEQLNELDKMKAR